MASEARRGCGYRKIGGLYLVSGGPGIACDRLPIKLDVCPVCSHGFKQARGWTWVDVAGLTGGVHPQCQDDFACPLCMHTEQMGKAGLLWIGEKFYKTPADYIKEGIALGYSKRIHAVPKGFKVGETWVLLAHPKAIRELAERTSVQDEPKEGVLIEGGIEVAYFPGIFQVWRPTHIEKILPESKRGSQEVQELEKRGITPVFVPDDDPDHQGTVYDKGEEEEEEHTGVELSK